MYRGFKSLRFLPLTEIKSKVNIPDTFPGLIVNALLFFWLITTLTFVLLSSYYPPYLPLVTPYIGYTYDVPSPVQSNLPLELRSLATEGTQEFPPLRKFIPNRSLEILPYIMFR